MDGGKLGRGAVCRENYGRLGTRMQHTHARVRWQQLQQRKGGVDNLHPVSAQPTLPPRAQPGGPRSPHAPGCAGRWGRRT